MCARLVCHGPDVVFIDYRPFDVTLVKLVQYHPSQELARLVLGLQYGSR